MVIGSVNSKNGIVIRLTAERWSHTESSSAQALLKHMIIWRGNQDIVFETIEKPDKIIEGDKSERFAVKYYPKTSISEKYVVVIYKEQTIDGFVITAFMTSKPEKIIKKGVIWKK